MHELGVRAHRDDVRAELFELFLACGQGRELRGTDKGEVSGIKKQDGPLFSAFWEARLISLKSPFAGS
jgi:hypothetical protein